MKKVKITIELLESGNNGKSWRYDQSKRNAYTVFEMRDCKMFQKIDKDNFLHLYASNSNNWQHVYTEEEIKNRLYFHREN